jgi:drug/metabolite transporter (DMT)-like permease
LKRAYLLILLAAVLFSTMEIVGRTLALALHPLQISFWRFLLASLVLAPMAVRGLRMRQVRWTSSRIVSLLAASLVGSVASVVFFQVALIHTKAATVAIIVSSAPIMIIVLAWLFLKERIGREMILSVAACVAGMLCILNPLEMSPEAAGIALAIGSAVTFALYSVIGKGATRALGSIPFSCLACLIGTAAMLAVIVLSHIAPLSSAAFPALFADIPLVRGMTPEVIAPLVYFGTSTGLGFIVYFQAIDETSAATGSVVFFIKPALAPLLAFLLLGERIPLNTVLGIGLIILGTYFAFSRRDAASPAKPALCDEVGE